MTTKLEIERKIGGKIDLRPKPLSSSKPLWHKQPGESYQAYAAFMTYLMMEDRSFMKTAEAVGKHFSLMGRWACQWSWTYRVGAYEEHFMLIRLESVEADRDRMWRDQKNLADTGIQVVQAALANLISQIDDSGNLDQLKGETLVRLLDTAAKIQRQAVLGRAALFDQVQERRQALHEEYSEELATVLQNFMNEMALNQEQQERAQEVLKELLVESK